MTYAGKFNGLNCQIIKQGSGTLSVGGFGGAFGGTTTISAGAIQVDGANLGTIVNNSLIIFNEPANETLSIGPSSTDAVYINGSGAFSKTGGGL